MYIHIYISIIHIGRLDMNNQLTTHCFFCVWGWAKAGLGVCSSPNRGFPFSGQAQGASGLMVVGNMWLRPFPVRRASIEHDEVVNPTLALQTGVVFHHVLDGSILAQWAPAPLPMAWRKPREP